MMCSPPAATTWLCTFCRHEISGFYRRTGKDHAVVELVEDDPEVAAALESLSAANDTGPEADLRRNETGRLVHLLLDRLPPRYSQALEWKYIDGLSVNEIAARLELTSKAAESMLTRAREAFREGFSILARGRVAGENA